MNIGTKYLVAIVDDDEEMLDIYESLFSENFRLYLTSDVDEFIQYVFVEKPQLIITDLQMPKKNGIEILTLVVEHFSCLKIIVSGFQDQSVISQANDLSDAFFAKPFDPEKLLNFVKTSLQKFYEK